MTRAVLYLRVSTDEQHVENQRAELITFVQARGWQLIREYADEGISGARERRPALDALLKDARRRRFDTLAVWSLDRLGRSLRHLVFVLDDLQALGIEIVSMKDSIDTTTPAGKLAAHIYGAFAEFERARLRERIAAGMARAKSQGRRVGRPRVRLTEGDLARVAHLSTRQAAQALGVSHTLIHRTRLSQKDRKVDVKNPTPIDRPAEPDGL
jgi:DNA invertase Pin-like site-specific DNA recombinase